ncbi:MAG TPA: hypothetical protein ENG51_10490 [Deltaproteobacteria bacterium]|nr:MAG: hypothetical protein DRG59_05775 [Deltaproteobacteria bacterium]HDM76884.1 hypothetical protein [Deltaproteobacteria bacterium]
MGHHRILGKTIDFIMGQEITDTDDERIRQRIARFLVEELGYEKNDIEVKPTLDLVCGKEKATAMIDFIVKINGRRAMLIKYGPGSLVSRERVVLAAARVMDVEVIPFAVITNGTEAEILDVESGKVIGTGMDAIPEKSELIAMMKDRQVKKLPETRKEIERRFLFVYEAIEHSSECDDEFCITRFE